jgi:hypothetical protein
MPTLKKATLQEISADTNASPVGAEIEVQFNPASLKLDLANRVEGGDSRGRQNRQYLGKTSTTLTFDLHFDTADQGTTDAPVSVRTLTAQVEKFVLPKGDGNTKQKPPKCRFHWDELVIDGLIESVSIDFDLFASNGTPLRAKMGVSIKEQDAKYELLQSGPGANTPGSPTVPGATSAGPGTTAPPAPDSSASALAGESAADFAARMGLDPSAWRGIAAGLNGASSLSLQAGLSIDFSASLSAGVGIGLSGGVQASVGASADVSFGLDASASASVGASAAATSAGFALAAAGGVGAAIESVAIVNTQSAASDARRAFASAVPSAPATGGSPTVSGGATAVGAASLPAASAAVSSSAILPPTANPPTPSMPDQTRTPLSASGSLPSPSAQAAAPSAPPPPMADPRATSFGFGVPLRPRVGSAADLRASAAAGRVPLRPRSRTTDVPVTTDPSIPPWMQLPASSTQAAAVTSSVSRQAPRPCGCSGPVHRGGCSCH